LALVAPPLPAELPSDASAAKHAKTSRSKPARAVSSSSSAASESSSSSTSSSSSPSVDDASTSSNADVAVDAAAATGANKVDAQNVAIVVRLPAPADLDPSSSSSSSSTSDDEDDDKEDADDKAAAAFTISAGMHDDMADVTESSSESSSESTKRAAAEVATSLAVRAIKARPLSMTAQRLLTPRSAMHERGALLRMRNSVVFSKARFLTDNELRNMGDIPLPVLFLTMTRMQLVDLARIAPVCRAWRKVAYDDSVWKETWRLDGRPRVTVGLREAYLQQRKVAASQRTKPGVWQAAIALFNGAMYHDAIAKLVQNGALANSPQDLTHLLFADGVKSAAVGDFLGDKHMVEIFEEFLLRLDFAGLSLQAAFRLLVTHLVLPASNSKIDHICRVFARRFYTQNANAHFVNADAVYMVTLMIIMLNTSINDAVGKVGAQPMTSEQFVELGAGNNGGADFPTGFLRQLYEDVVAGSYQPVEDDEDDSDESADASSADDSGSDDAAAATALSATSSSSSSSAAAASAASAAAAAAAAAADDDSGGKSPTARSAARDRRRDKWNAALKDAAAPSAQSAQSAASAAAPLAGMRAKSPRHGVVDLNSESNKRSTISFVIDVLKEGWLSKQSSGLVKKWTKRWFVLKSNNCLYYYKTADTSKALGIIPLNDVRITVDLSNKRYLINVESAHAHDGDGMHAAKLRAGVAVRNTKTKYTLCGKSKDECNAWSQLLQSCVGQVVSVDSLSELMASQRGAKERKKAKKQQQQQQQQQQQHAAVTAGASTSSLLVPPSGAIPARPSGAASAAAAAAVLPAPTKRGLFGSIGKRDVATLRTRPIYGVSLDVLAERDGQPVPILVQRAIEYLMATALDEEGLLRLSGSHADMDALRSAFEAGQPIDFRTPPRDAHTVAGMLKAFFRELPEPLLTPELNRRAADVVAQQLPEIAAALELRHIIVSMADPAYETMKLLVQFLIAVADHSIKNRMHKDNVLTVMIPTLQCVPAVFSIAMDCFELFFDDESTGRVAGGTIANALPDESQSPRVAISPRTLRHANSSSPPGNAASPARVRAATNDTASLAAPAAATAAPPAAVPEAKSEPEGKARTLPRRIEEASSPPRSPSIARPQTKAPQPPGQAGKAAPELRVSATRRRPDDDDDGEPSSAAVDAKNRKKAAAAAAARQPSQKS
jgi:hypothetical protein